MDVAKKAGLDSVVFGERRLLFCEKIFTVQNDIRKEIEKKAQLLLAALTGLVGLLSLDGTLVRRIPHSLSHRSSLAAEALLPVSLTTALVFLVLSIVSVALTLRPASGLYPLAEVPSTTYFGDDPPVATDLELLEEAACLYAMATESLLDVNRSKSRWLTLGYYSLLITLASIGTLTFIILPLGG